MKTFRLWLEPDPEIPQFKRLAYEKVDVAIADVLLKGIHPWLEGMENRSLSEKFMEILNSDDSKLPALTEYCGNMSWNYTQYPSSRSSFEENLWRVTKEVYFVKALDHFQLLEVAQQRLRKNWQHRLAHNMLQSVYHGFNSMRTFLKQKNKRIKLSRYHDLELYDLGQVLSLEDFEGEDRVIIQYGMPTCNFRLESFLEKVTDEYGLLRLTDRIGHFNLSVNPLRSADLNGTVTYNCHLEGDKVRFLPNLKNYRFSRKPARAIAREVAMDNGKYCFTTDIPSLNGLLERKLCEIKFPHLDYLRESSGSTSSADVAESKVERFSIGSFVTEKYPGDRMRSICRRYNISMRGNKEHLVEKLARLSAGLYRKFEPEMNEYFSKERFIRVESGQKAEGSSFPVMGELDMKNMLVAMYAVRHMRGNTILEAFHVNDTFELEDLSRALIKGDVHVNGVFVKVER